MSPHREGGKKKGGQKEKDGPNLRSVLRYLVKHAFRLVLLKLPSNWCLQIGVTEITFKLVFPFKLVLLKLPF
jgi:hypothetical protein